MNYPEVNDVYGFIHGSEYNKYWKVLSISHNSKDSFVELKLVGYNREYKVTFSLKHINKDFIKCTEMEKVLYVNY